MQEQIAPAQRAVDKIDDRSSDWLMRLISSAILISIWIAASVAAAWQSLGLGLDYLQYANFYWNFTANWLTPEARFEPGIKLWALIAQMALNLSFEWFMLTLIATALAIKFILFSRRTVVPLLAILAYGFVFYPVLEYTQIRAAMGVALTFAAVFAFLDGRLKQAIFFFVSAIAFHYSMAVAAVVVLGSGFVGTRIRLAVALGIAGIALLSLSTYLGEITSFLSQVNPLTERYVYNIEQNEEANVFSVWNIAIAFAVTFGVAFGLYDDDRTDRVLILMSLAGLVSVVLFRNSVELALRLREVFSLSTIFFVFRQPPVPWRWIPAAVLLAASAYVFVFNQVGQTVLF
jgi:hypothetical protein